MRHIALQPTSRAFDLSIRFLPNYPTTFEDVNTCESRFAQDLCRPDARFVIGAGAVGNDVAVSRDILERRKSQPVLKAPEFYINGALDLN